MASYGMEQAAIGSQYAQMQANDARPKMRPLEEVARQLNDQAVEIRNLAAQFCQVADALFGVAPTPGPSPQNAMTGSGTLLGPLPMIPAIEQAGRNIAGALDDLRHAVIRFQQL